MVSAVQVCQVQALGLRDQVSLVSTGQMVGVVV
jgi:hypothetical protein